MLIEKHGGAGSRSTREELQELPGVGRKTANVVLNIAFGQNDASRSIRISFA
jgi:endonuclease-3